MSSNTPECVNFLPIISTFFGSFFGVIIGAILNNRFVIKSTDLHFFNIAAIKFRKEIHPFYSEVREMLLKDNKGMIGNNETWSYRRMQQILPEHRKIIEEFIFSIPINHRHSFDIIADTYCPQKETYTEDDINAMYWSGVDMKVEMSIRNKIKEKIEQMMNFKIT